MTSVEKPTYELIAVKLFNRQVGLRTLSDIQLFSLSLLQQKCGVTVEEYEQYKPFVEQELSQKVKYAFWKHISS